jgi:hypothetical protein
MLYLLVAYSTTAVFSYVTLFNWLKLSPLYHSELHMQKNLSVSTTEFQ